MLENLVFPHWKSSNAHAHPTHNNYKKYSSLFHKDEELPNNKTLIFQSEGALLKSPSLFPYFMLVAFEAGGPLRALVLFLIYPFLWLVGEDEELGLKIMVFLCFFGIREDEFRLGSSVLPKYFLENVGCEGVDVVMRFGRRVGVSELPRIMVEGFLKEYLGVETVVGRELKVVCGYFVGLMEEKKSGATILNKVFGEEKMRSGAVVGFGCFNKPSAHKLFSHCKPDIVVYLVSEDEKSSWQNLPREKYPKPLIFHDGRLAFTPTPLNTLVMLMWLPIGILLCMIRIIIGTLLPLHFSNLMLALTGLRTTVSKPKPSSNIPTSTDNNNEQKRQGVLYVCNHRTLLDPIYVSTAIMNRCLTAFTYSISRFTEVISPIRTVRLKRDRERDKKMLEEMLCKGNVVVCPEGTTCREPYLLRFSPLFAEISEEIVPVAIDMQVSMFYGSTASGLKFLDPVFHLLNPYPTYSVNILEKLPGSYTSKVGGKSKFEVANHVQNEIAKALGFECTSLTRKDKYLILAGNNGIM